MVKKKKDSAVIRVPKELADYYKKLKKQQACEVERRFKRKLKKVLYGRRK